MLVRPERREIRNEFSSAQNRESNKLLKFVGMMPSVGVQEE